MHFHNQSNKYQLWCNLHWLHTSTATARWQSVQQVSSPMQPPLTTHNQWQSSFTIDSISLKSEATSIDYVQPMAKRFHNQSAQSPVWSNLDSPCTTTGKGVSQSIQSVTTLKQHWWTTYKHWYSTFTIKPITINSDATLIHYVQAVAQHFFNEFD